jgi:plasmid stabilization system protein ParE
MYLLAFPKQIDIDFDSCYEYITEKLEAPRAAENLFDEIIIKLDYICETPFTRPLVQDRYLASLGIRSIKIKNYVLYFNVDEEKNTVNLVRFLYNKRDWIHILKEKI